jgi:diguanylate cyclase (GGDEF)-like protein
VTLHSSGARARNDPALQRVPLRLPFPFRYDATNFIESVIRAIPDRERIRDNVLLMELRLLMVEDVPAEAEIAAWQLKSAGLNCAVRRVEREQEFRDALLQWQPDIVLSDFTLPQFDGLTALEIAMTAAPDVPFIFLSGTIGEEHAIQTLKRGAVDYVLKTNLARLAPAVRRALEEAESRRARRAAEDSVTRLSRVLQMLSGINTAVVRIFARDELLDEACRLAHRIGGYAFAFVALIEPGTRGARPVAWAGENVQDLRDVVFTIGDCNDSDASVTSRVLRTGEAAISTDHTACLPLSVDGTTIGALMFGAPSGARMSEEELRLLKEVAANLSFALQYLEKQDAIRFLSYFDSLTGLAKRALFCERLGRFLADPNRVAVRPTVVVFDVEHMSALNDALGRHVGDLLLQCIADRLKGRLGHSEYAAHLGGATFACLIHDVDGNDLRRVHGRVTDFFDDAFPLEGRELPISVISGVAVFPENGSDAATLVQNAEAALKAAKGNGEKMVRHRPGMNSALAERLATEHRLRAALGRNEFQLYYQPKVSLRSGRIVGVEALLRWVDPIHGVKAPAAFLPILESTGLITSVGEWALMQAAEDCKRWERCGFSPVRIAVNAAPVQLRRRDFAAKVIDAAAGLNAERGWGLDIEITEGAVLDDAGWTVRTLRVLRSAGVRVAIDDFGTGYSSLSRLSQLPVDTLKIDRSFTSRLPEAAGCTLVSTIIGLARAFKMTTVAEGVERDDQLDFLQRAGCDESQGYLHSRPVAAPDFEALLTQRAGLLIPRSFDDDSALLEFVGT